MGYISLPEKSKLTKTVPHLAKINGDEKPILTLIKGGKYEKDSTC